MIRRALVLCAVACVLAHCWWFAAFTVDDAAISFSYARSFANGDGLVLLPGGERVEGYTNFLWVVLLALGVRLGVDVFLWSHLLGAALAVATVLGVAELVAALRGRRSPWDAAPALVTASLLPIPYWAMSGLEGSLYCALVIWTLARTVNEHQQPERRPLSALLAAGAVLTRPDGLALYAVVFAVRLLRPRPVRRLLVWLALALAPVLLHFVWRTIYYAYPLPNTFYAKVQAPFRLAELFDPRAPGWQYVLGLCGRYRLGFLIGPAGLALWPGRGFLLRAAVVCGLGGLVFFPLYARGDWMSEGRFLVAALPVLCALAAVGIGVGCELLRRRALQVGVASVVALGVGAAVVPGSLSHSQKRRGNYPVPAEFVAVRGKFYRQIADEYRAGRPSALDGDLGGTSFYSGMPIVDLGMLGDVTMARWKQSPAVLREYVHGERQPTFQRLIGFWLREGIQNFPEFAERYVPSRVHPDISIDRRIFLEDAMETRTPLFRFAGADLLRAEVGEDVRLWLLAKQPGAALALVAERGSVPVEHPYLLASLWRPGEVIKLRLPRPDRTALRLCELSTCAVLAEGTAGAPLVPWPQPAACALDAASRRGELELALVLFERAGASTRELGRRLDRRSRAALAAGDPGRAFRDALLALRAAPELSWARRRVEELRQARREAYPHEAELQLESEQRAFRLQPDAQRIGGLATRALQAAKPERAALAYLATRIAPERPSERLDLAECLLRAGALDEAAALLPISSTVPAERARAHRIAVATGRPDRAPYPTAAAIAVAPGLGLVDAWARRLPSGRAEVALALTRTADAAPDRLRVAGLAVPFDRPPSTWEPGEVVVHTVALNLADGVSTVDIGSLSRPIEVEPRRP